jgi:outer membrane PBP1 activator LpoA protein
MAAISRRPRLTLCALLAMTLPVAACSLVRPAEAPEGSPANAKALADTGKHAAAARAYAELAGAAPADHDNYELLSAEQWVAAGDPAAAKQALSSVSADARTRLPTSRALVAAEVALAQKDGVTALHELESIDVPAQADLAQNYWLLRGEAGFLTGRPVEATRAYIERERYLDDPGKAKANRDALFAQLRSAAERGQALTPPPKSDPILAGWLQLGAVAVQLERDPGRAAPALANWRRLFPQHPANDIVLETAQTQMTVASEFPDKIALLLPLSGRTEAAGVAVRDGFIAAYLEQDAAARPQLAVYDVAAESVASAYQRAVQDGAGFIVGPLTKEDVAALAPLSNGRTSILALNFLSDSVAAPHDFYQFALLPEDEARIVARRLSADGKLNGVVILPEGEWGTRVGNAFADELSHLGGTVLDGGRYESTRADFSDVIRRVLQVHEVKGEPASHRTDAQFVFVASATPATARLLVSQLKFHYAGDVPVYSTSDSFEPDPAANSDLDGMSFPDMPWMVSSDPVTGQIRDAVRTAWPTRTARRDRLYAFGYDAYRLVPELKANALSGTQSMAGVTGKLRLDEHNRIRRDLAWAYMKGGVPVGF